MNAGRSITFTLEMVRALRRTASPKTQTRRVITPQPQFAQFYSWPGQVYYDGEARQWFWKGHDLGDGDPIAATPGPKLVELCPYGHVGDRLWVRESYCVVDGEVHYRADLTDEQLTEERKVRRIAPKLSAAHPTWRSGRFMRREYSRTTLELVDVRAQRLQDISEDDARAEGVTLGEPLRARINGVRGTLVFFNPIKAYAVLWDAINGKRPGCSWRDNPWVWALTFKELA